MIEEDLEQNLIKKIRFMTHFLLISGSLNIALGATLVTFALREKSQDTYRPFFYTKNMVSLSKENHQVLSSFFHKSFSEMLEELRNEELVEDGYRKRDLALAYLAAFHYFDVEKALPGIAIQKRKMTFIHQEGGERLDLTVFPGLNDDHYQALLYYAHIEKWPLTSEGLFYELLRRKESAPSSLIDTFCMTEEFHQVYNYLSHNGLSLNREMFLQLLLEGNYAIFQDFFCMLKQDLTPQDFTTHFLLSYVRANSKMAADLLIEVDREFALRKLADSDLAILIENLVDREKCAKSFLTELIYSVRSDLIRKKAALKLYALIGEEPPDPYDHNETLKRFLPAVPKAHLQIQDPIFIYQKPKVMNHSLTSQRTHFVQDGETLWKIAKKYRVDVQRLMQYNRLHSEYSLPVGKELIIP